MAKIIGKKSLKTSPKKAEDKKIEAKDDPKKIEDKD